MSLADSLLGAEVPVESRIRTVAAAALTSSNPRSPLLAPTHIFGVDFSAAEATAGRGTVLAEGRVDGPLLVIDRCLFAADLPNSGLERNRCLPALRAYLARQRGAAVGLDFPFGLPRSHVVEPDWPAFARAFTSRYPDPENFRSACWSEAGERELKRRTDRETRTPHGVANLRLYKQTYYGIGAVLAPLVREDTACVLPMQTPRPDHAWLLETCPASTLKEANRYPASGQPGYKGPSVENRAARERLLNWLVTARAIRLGTPSLARTVRDDDSGDFLDSILAAAAAFRATRRPDGLLRSLAADYTLEGMVYV